MCDIGRNLYQLARNSSEKEFNDKLWELIAGIVKQEVEEHEENIKYKYIEGECNDDYCDEKFDVNHFADVENIKKYLCENKYNVKAEMSRDEIDDVRYHHDLKFLKERIWSKLKKDFIVGNNDYAKFRQVILNIANAYNKYRSYCCDDEISMEEAFDECFDEIAWLV